MISPKQQEQRSHRRLNRINSITASLSSQERELELSQHNYSSAIKQLNDKSFPLFSLDYEPSLPSINSPKNNNVFVQQFGSLEEKGYQELASTVGTFSKE